MRDLDLGAKFYSSSVEVGNKEERRRDPERTFKKQISINQRNSYEVCHYLMEGKKSHRERNM